MKAICLVSFVSGNKQYKKGEVYDFDEDVAYTFKEHKLIRFLNENHLLKRHENVSIVVLVKDALECTKKCLESIVKNTNNYELIIVDNNSKSLTKKFLNDFDLTDFVLIRNSKNKGVSYGWNQAIKIAKYDYICFINSDCIVSNNWLHKLMQGFKIDSKIGIVGPSGNKYPNGKSRQFAISLGDNVTQDDVDKISLLMPSGQYEETDVVGFCWVIKKEVFKKIGVFNWKRFGLATWEDIDFLRRAKAAGYKSVWMKEAFVYHFGNKTTKEIGIDPYKLRVDCKKNYFEAIKNNENYIENDVEVKNVIYRKGNIPILTITFNRFEYTKKAIEYMHKNTSNFIHYIFDNNSEDSTRQYLENFRDKAIIEYSNKNTGLVYPMNVFFEKFKNYRYVAKVDNDTIVGEGWLEKLKEVMDEIPLFAVEANHYLMLRYAITKNEDYYRNLFSVDFKGNKLYLCNMVGGTGVLIRRSFIKEPITETGGLGGFLAYQRNHDFMSAFYTGVWIDRLDQVGTNKYKEPSNYPEYDKFINKLRPRSMIGEKEIRESEFRPIREKAKRWWAEYGCV